MFRLLHFLILIFAIFVNFPTIVGYLPLSVQNNCHISISYLLDLMISLYLLFSLHLWGLLHWELLFLPVSLAWLVIFVIFVLFVEPPSLGPCSPSRTFILATVACFIGHFHYICYFRCVCYICGVPFPYLPSRIVILAAHLLHVIFANIIFVSTKTGKGVARGVLGCPWPPFCKPFLTKQPTTGGKNAMTISCP